MMQKGMLSLLKQATTDYKHVIEENILCIVGNVTAKVNRDASTYTVTIPKVNGTYGSYFRTCNFGAPKVHGLPCDHMAVLVKLGQVHGLNENNVMPLWWITEQMNLQFPCEQVMVGGMDMDLLKRMGNANNFILYCPQCTTPQKKGHPLNSIHIRGLLEGSVLNNGG